MKDFFVSYTEPDEAWAKWVAWRLEEAGYTTVLQAWDFCPGSNFPVEMDKASREAARTLAILSPAYLESLFAQSEWAAAFHADPTGSQRTLVPLRVEPCDPEGLLGSIVHVNLVGLEETDAAQALLNGVKKGRAKPQTPPRFPRARRSPPARPTFPAAPPSGLPGRPHTFGRIEEVRVVVANATARPPLPTVVLGPGGIGKTNLCLAALHHPDVASRFGHRRVFVRLETATSAAAAALELANAAGVDPLSPHLLGRVLGNLAAAPVIVVLDNAETPWEADTLDTEELFSTVAGVPGVALVASLRGNERPGGPAWAPPIRVGPLDPGHTRTLFRSVAGSGFDRPELDRLLAEMGGVPLAVELLAHTAEGEPDLASLAQRWRNERVRLLKRGKADHRLLSVAVSVEASWVSHLMTEDARHLLSLLGRLPDGIALSDLSELMPEEGPAAANDLVAGVSPSTRRPGSASTPRSAITLRPSTRLTRMTAGTGPSSITPALLGRLARR